MRDKSDLLLCRNEKKKLCELFFRLSSGRNVSTRSIALWLTMFSYVYVHSNQSTNIGMFTRLRRAILVRTHAKLWPRCNYVQQSSTLRKGAKQRVTTNSTTRYTDASLRNVTKLANRVRYKTQNERVLHSHNTTDVLPSVRYSFYERCLFYVNKLACVGKLQYKRALHRKQASNDNNGVPSAPQSYVLAQYAEQRHKRRLTLARSLKWAMRDRHEYRKSVKNRQRLLQNTATVRRHNKQKRIHNTILPQFISLWGSTKPLCLLHSSTRIETPTNWLLREIARCRPMRVSSIVASLKIRINAKFRFIKYSDILNRLYKSTAYVACMKYNLHVYTVANATHMLGNNIANNTLKNWKLSHSKPAFIYIVLLMILRYRHRKLPNSLFSKIFTFFKVLRRSNTSLLQRTEPVTNTIIELTHNIIMRSSRRWLSEKKLIVKARRKLRRHIKYYAHTRRSGKAKWYHV